MDILYTTPSEIPLVIFFTANTRRVMIFLFFQNFISNFHCDTKFLKNCVTMTSRHFV